jgi:O-glycosyl hydrolase
LTLARITIGTSDFAPLPFYTYNDLADPYDTDVNLTQFSVAHDEAYVLPTIKSALEVAGVPGNDTLRIFASPWSPPAWMKTSHVLGGGTLLAAHENTYARYLLRFLSAYEARGVHVDALTIQNEPLNNDSRYPCMLLQPEQEGRVIEQMYRVFQAGDLRSLPAIWSFDQNFADWWYPAQLLNDTRYARFVNGSAFHHYAGSPSDMTKLHVAFPDSPIMFTEGSGFGLLGAGHIVNIFRNWATTYTSWVTMLDKDRKPNSGPWGAGETMLELDGSVQDGHYSVKYNYEYYMYGQFSKFVRTGAIRIDSGSATTWLNHVAFVNPSSARGTGNAGATVVIVVNNWFWAKDIQLRCGGRVATARLPGWSVATFRWKQHCTMESGEQVIV